MIVSTVTVVHIGTNIENTVLAVGDSESSPHITLVSNVSPLKLVNTTEGYYDLLHVGALGLNIATKRCFKLSDFTMKSIVICVI